MRPEEYYLAMCSRLKCNPDPSVITSLATNWTFIKASNGYSLLPLLELIKHECASDPVSLVNHLETLRVKGSSKRTHLSDANAMAIAQMLPHLKALKNLIVSQISLSHYGSLELFEGLKKNTSLERLDISNNPGIGPAIQTGKLGETLIHHPTLHELNIKNNQLGFSEVTKLRMGLREAQKDKGKDFIIHDDGNNVYEEVLNTLTHGVGCLFAIVGSVVLMYQASSTNNAHTYYAALVYCFSLVFLYLSSTLLHAFFMHETASSVLGVMDHSAIYLLIAGTYFPLCVISLEDHPLGIPLAIIEWGLAFIGIFFCFVAEKIHIPGKIIFEILLYLGMGWLVVLAVEDFQDHIDPGAVELLIWGGLMYTGGVTFFILEKTTHPIGHAIWHLFVLAGTVFHYFAILFYVVGYKGEEGREVCVGGIEEQFIGLLKEMMDRIEVEITNFPSSPSLLE